MATLNNSKKLDTLIGALQTDRLIEIYIAKNTTPLFIQAAVLTSTSEYFIRALKNEDSLGGEKGILRFPEDDEIAWKMFMYWKFTGKLQSVDGDKEEVMKQLIHCWALGDKYDIKDFQDLIMLELLNEVEETTVPLEVIKLAFENAPQNSALRQLMAREAVINIHEDEDEARYLEIFDGVAGSLSDLVEAYELRDTRDGDVINLQGILNDDNEDDWKDFMVGEGPEKHWIHGQ